MSRHAPHPARRVVYDHRIFSKQQFGGISRYFTELARHLGQDTSWDVRVLALAHVNDHLRTLDPRLVQGWRVPHRMRLAPLWKTIDDLLTRRLLPGIGADLIHETYYDRESDGLRDVARVVTVYDMIHERFPGLFPTEHDLPIAKRAAVLRADRVICISESTRRDLLEFVPVDPSRVVVVPLAASRPAGAGAPLPTDLTDRPFVLVVGTRGAHKNFAGLLRALHEVPEVLTTHRIVLFGSAPLDAGERTLLRALALPEQAFVHIGQDERLLQTLYERADALVYPSTYEGFGLPVLEAMQAGCPVICGDVASLPEVVGEAGIRCDTTDPAVLGTTLRALLADPAEREHRRRLGIARASLFSWERCARETATVYEGALLARSAPSALASVPPAR